MATYVVSLWDFTGDSSLEQIAFVENSLIKITDRAAPAGWSYGVCEVGGAKGFFPLNYTEPYEPEKHTNIPPPVVEEIQPAEFPLIEQQPGEQPVPEVTDLQQYSAPIDNGYQDNTGGYVDNSFEQQQPPEEQTPELPPLTNVPLALPPPGGGTPPPAVMSGRPFVRQPIPPSAKGGPTPGPSTPVSSPVKPSPTTTFNNPSPKPSPTSFNNFNSPKPSPTPTSHVKPTPTSFSPTPKPNPGMGIGMGVGSPKPSPTSNPISARAAAPIQRSGSTPRPRPVSTFIQNAPPPSQPMIRGKPVGGFQPSAESPSGGGGGGGSPFGVSNGGGGGSPFTPINGGGGGGASFGPSNGGGGPAGGGEPVAYCEALFDYTGDPSKNIFSFPKGARIELKVKYESGWWSGVLDGVEGYFPSNFVKELPVTPRGRGGPATTDSMTSPNRRQQDENRRKSLGAPMSRSVMGPKGGMGSAHSSLSMSQQDMPSARMTFSSPGGGSGGIPAGGRGMPVMMGMGGGPVGNGSAEDDKKKKGGIFSALKKKKNKDKAQTHI